MNTKTSFIQSYFRTMNLSKKVVVTILAVIAAVVLPQLVHSVGIFAGVGSKLGEILLPMHLPILLVGFLAGPYAGLVAGLFAPMISFVLTGMPGIHMLPFITIELVVYGIMAGLLQKKRMPAVGKVVLSQVAGRVVKGAAIFLSVFAFGNQTVALGVIYTSVIVGIIGIVLQLILVPVVLGYIEEK